jgi:hypothetical protein
MTKQSRIYGAEIATPACRNGELRRAGTLSLVARNDDVKAFNAFVLMTPNFLKSDESS